ncbi:hypothetical protein ACFE04_030217 [Oxalis oulophora]
MESSSKLKQISGKTTAGVRVFKWNQALPEDVLPRGNGVLMIHIASLGLTTASLNLQILSCTKTLQKFIYDLIVETFDDFYSCHNDVFVSTICKKITHSYVFDVVELSRASAKKIVIVADIIVSPNSPTQATWILNRSRVVASLTDFLNIDLFYEGGEGDYSETCGLVLIPSLRELKRVRTEEFKSDKNKECAICLEELSSLRDRSTCRKMTCSHVFHGDCVGRWFWENPSCPLCRFPLPERFRCSAKRFQVNYLSTGPSQ